jgi:hypothetical protein
MFCGVIAKDKPGVRVDEFTNEPRRTHAVNPRPRPGEPGFANEFAASSGMFLDLPSRKAAAGFKSICASRTR